MKYTQKNRFIAINTPLGEDTLLLTHFSGVEGISKPFNFFLKMFSEDHSLSFENIIGKQVSVSIRLADDSKRFFNGIIYRFSRSRVGGKEGEDVRFSYFEATMVPYFKLLEHTINTRIFQNKSVPDIIKQIFKERGLQNYSFKLNKTYSARTYCVQYQETDFDFISRLLSEEGIFYFFEHTSSLHKMILADASSHHKSCPKQKSAIYQLTGGGAQKEDFVISLQKKQQIQSGKISLNDFNYETPNVFMACSIKGNVQSGPGEREIYEHPGKYSTLDDGNRIARIRMEEQDTYFTTISGTSNCRAFTSGFRFKIEKFIHNDLNNKELVLVHIEHNAEIGYNYPGTLTQSKKFQYHNTFTCIPYDVPFRPSRKFQKPKITGIQTAIVVGPSGEEIFTDNEGYGRVKVQFHWDREGKYNENSSCWIRVSQNWADKNWGIFTLPRIGQEVIVSFVDGDPDKPIIVGCVHNAIALPPYKLPKEKTKSTIKTLSSKNGGGYNEIRFEDKKDNEQIFVHAQKDIDIRIENDSRTLIEKKAHTIIKDNQISRIDGKKSLIVAKDNHIKVKNNYALDTDNEIHVKAGQKIIIEAGSKISIKVGGSFINIDSSSIYINSPMIYLNSGGSPENGSGCEPDVAEEADKGKPGTRAKVRTG